MVTGKNESLNLGDARQKDPTAVDVLLERLKAPEPLSLSDLAGLPGLPAEAGAGPSIDDSVVRGLKLRVKVELGSTELPLREATRLRSGQVVELGKAADRRVLVLVNDVPIARGEVLTVQGRFCVRVLEILSSSEAGGTAHGA